MKLSRASVVLSVEVVAAVVKVLITEPVRIISCFSFKPVSSQPCLLRERGGYANLNTACRQGTLCNVYITV